MDQAKQEIPIIAFKMFPKENPSHGIILPLFKILGSSPPLPITTDNFCPSGKVFIPSGYEDINDKFNECELFKIPVTVSLVTSEKVDPSNACTYVGNGKKSERIVPKFLIEIFFSELPDCNNRFVDYEQLPSTKYIFVRTANNGCYGPFEWSINQNGSSVLELHITTAPLPGQQLEPGQIYKLNEKQYDKQLLKTENGRHYLFDLATVIQAGEFHDYASDLEIIHYCGKHAAAFKTAPLEKKSLRTLEMQGKANTKPLIKQRWDRFSSIATTLIDTQEDVTKLLGEYLNSQNGESILEAYVSRNADKYLKAVIEKENQVIQEATSKANEEIKAANDRLKEINDQKKQATLELENTRVKLKRLPEEVSIDKKALHAELDTELNRKKEEIAHLEEKIKQLVTNDSSLSTLEGIKAKTTEANIIFEESQRRRYDLEKTIAELAREYDASVDEISKRLSKMTPMVKAIIGYSSNVHKELPVIDTPIIGKIDEGALLQEQERICSEVEQSLVRHGRFVHSAQVANLLICTQQSFITFLAGLPGAGKTSLSRLLAKAQSLKPRLNEISVGRGWTSQKDLIGFYNPLVSKFQPSNTGLYEFLLALEAEGNSKINPAMAYVLLDEANLSPIEHYWSAFVGMTDNDGDKLITLGSDDVKIPNHLRFIATINHDGTTEPLSPRIVDRAPIIVMENTPLPGDFAAEANAVVSSLPVSAADMEMLFGNSLEVPLLNDAEEPIFNAIRAILADPAPEKGRPIIISVRKVHAIRQYCNKARALMNFDSDLLAFDFAVLQHVLPQVRGSGVKFAKRIEELLKLCKEQNLNLSENYLNRMLSYGAAELHSYDFFCW